MSDFLTTKPYKGTRDFYPEDMRFRRWMFAKWSDVCRRYGYGEVDGPMLEPLSMYAAKTSDEIVSKQLYHFIDRGERSMAIRPEFTPTIARMAAAKLQELSLPVRWFGIPNVFRYENPQRGRLREHWQLNVDIFGAPAPQSEIEIICLAQDLLKAFGASSDMYEVKVNSRRLTDFLFKEILKLTDGQIQDVSGALDKRAKIGDDKFKVILQESDVSEDQITHIFDLWSMSLAELKEKFGEREAIQEIDQLLSSLSDLGYGDSLSFDLSVMRGFTYYTGIVFEVFDKHPDNNRSMFGGGRYDNLVNAFTKQKLSGIGFGMGDVTFENFLKTNNLISIEELHAKVAIILMGKLPEDSDRAQKIASELRSHDIDSTVLLAGGKVGKQIQTAEKMGFRYVVFYGSQEEEKRMVTCKDLHQSEQFECSVDELVNKISSH